MINMAEYLWSCFPGLLRFRTSLTVLVSLVTLGRTNRSESVANRTSISCPTFSRNSVCSVYQNVVCFGNFEFGNIHVGTVLGNGQF